MQEETTYLGLPARWRVLSGSALKLIATIVMLVDHVNHHLLAYVPAFRQVLFVVGAQVVTPTYLLYVLGRIAFPLYCFLLVEGFVHTHDVRRYACNLLAFALISEVPWDLEHGGVPYLPDSQNVFFTLFLGLLALVAIKRWQGRAQRPSAVLELAVELGAVTALGTLLAADYGVRGIALIILLYLLRNGHLLRAVAGCLVLKSHQLALPAFVLMELYNGERGFVHGGVLKYAFYAFYPVHILIIALIKMHLGYV